MKKLIFLSETGEYKPICANCNKNYHCSGQSECLNMMMKYIYDLEALLELTEKDGDKKCQN